jgi:hypothetical protein
MPNYLIQIDDSANNSFFISMSIPARSWAVPSGNAGSWRVTERGFIKHVGGAMWWEEAKGTATGKHLNLLHKGYWGLKLFEFKDFWGVSSNGSGVLLQSWVLQCEPGRVTWLLSS